MKIIKEFIESARNISLFPPYASFQTEFYSQSHPDVVVDFEIVHEEACTVCGGRLSKPNLSTCHVVKVKHEDRRWPDIIRSPTVDSWIINEKVANEMSLENLTGFVLHELSFERIAKKRRPTQHYWVVAPIGKAAYKALAPEQYEKWICHKCGRIDAVGIYRANIKTNAKIDYLFSADLYDGSDWVNAAFAGMHVSVMCSPRVIDAAGKHGWENAFFHLPCWTHGYENIFVDYFASNWRDLLDYDITLRTAELSLAETPECWGKEVETNVKKLKARGETLMPYPRPEPIYGLHKPPVLNDMPVHPFDDLSPFDGVGWQGNTKCASLFDETCFSINADERYTPHHTDGSDYDDSVLPTKTQRKLFDMFIANEQKILPELKNRLLSEIAREKPELALPPSAADFLMLASLLKMPFLFIEEPIKRNIGTIQLSYNLDNTNPIIDIVAAIECDLRTGGLRIVSCEIEKSIRPDA